MSTMRAGRQQREELVVSGTRTLVPRPEILDALKQAYAIEASVADLVDNSIDAGASNVLVRFLQRADRIESLFVVDDGSGMDASTIDQAMRFAQRREYDSSALGMFGVGLKTASLSQANVLTVLSRARGREPVGRRWTTDGIKARNWECEDIEPSSIRGHLDDSWGRIGRIARGTIVRWDQVREFDRLSYAPEKYLDSVTEKLRRHLGLKLHRFLKRKQINITIDTQDAETREVGLPSTVVSVDPFPERSGVAGYPRVFSVEVPKYGCLDLKAHVWPRKSKEEGYKLGRGNVAAHQGFYFLRHNRLIQDGGWNGFRGDGEPHLSLARVEIDVPDAFMGYLEVRPNKAGVDVPPSFAEHIARARCMNGTTLQSFLEDAERIYRTHGEHRSKPLVSPADGVPAPVRVALERCGVPFLRGSGIRVTWGRVSGEDFFEVDREARVLLLNEQYRRVLLRGQRGGKTDLPMIRTLLFFLLNSTFERERMNELEEERLAWVNAALLAAVRLEKEKADAPER